MPVADLAPDTRSLDLGAFSAEPGEYTVYVKAIGKPSLTNLMSQGRSITIPADPRGSSSAIQFNLQLSVTTAVAPASITATVDGGPFLPNQTVIDFGDDSVTTGETAVEHVYKLPGVYTVMVSVTNQAGMRSTQTAAITVTGQ
jgi:PKD repeat protein